MSRAVLLCSAALLIAATAVGLALAVSVRIRRHDIGILRALGLVIMALVAALPARAAARLRPAYVLRSE